MIHANTFKLNTVLSIQNSPSHSMTEQLLNLSNKQVLFSKFTRFSTEDLIENSVLSLKFVLNNTLIYF